MRIPESIFKNLTDQQKKQVEAAKSADELLSVARKYGQELTDEQVEGIAGGWGDRPKTLRSSEG